MQKNSKCKCVDFDSGNRNELYGHFVFTSLEKGEGTTIGNMLRRTLLSNLYGFRVVGVRFAGINNEFTQLEGVREDILEIILNLKEIILIDSNKTDQACFGFVKVQGPGIVTAGCLKLPNNVRVANPNAHLLTISDKSIIELAVKIEFGKSYVFAKDQKIKEFRDFIPIDSNFAPILKVNWYSKLLPQDVENNNEELHLEIFTNGTLLPHRALIEARNTIGQMLSPITNMEFPYLESLEKKILERKTIVKKEVYSEKPQDENILEEENLFKVESKQKSLGGKKKNIKDSSLEISPKNSILTNKVKSKLTDKIIRTIEKEKKLQKESLEETSVKAKSIKSFIKPVSKKGKDTSLITKANKIKENPTKIKTDTSKDKLFEKVNERTNESLKKLGLSNRVLNALKSSNLNSVEDLIAYPSSNLIAVPGLGMKSVIEINTKLNLFYESFPH
uniref:RNA polymerase alpha subunit n=1 Tax=Analipus japonicus TaxID=31333 RepID=UPI002E789077|nr:RNA polymerase alpha subunit [Analipus japonicus]WAM61874.1 RNA polymerase alpha subunit [Analipus japonicus]